MKIARYNWDNGIYLILVEVINNKKDAATIRYSRVIEALGSKDEEVQYLKSGERRRFMISKKSIKETSIMIMYEHDVEVKVFRLLDRAYLPTDSDICRLETL